MRTVDDAICNWTLHYMQWYEISVLMGIFMFLTVILIYY